MCGFITVFKTYFSVLMYTCIDTFFSSSSFPSRTTECGGYFTVRSGTFTSPNYPNNYDNNLDCNYVFKVERGQLITINFIDFSIQYHDMCYFDEVAVSITQYCMQINQLTNAAPWFLLKISFNILEARLKFFFFMSCTMMFR